MSLAQQEADQFLNEKPQPRTHPEDQHQTSSDNESISSRSGRRDPAYLSDKPQGDDNDDTDAMISNSAPYHIPSTTFAANTGPKGVIADAQAYEAARKKSFRRTLMNATGLSRDNDASKEKPMTQPQANESEDERFMRQWREARMKELQQQSTARRTSPVGKRKYGTVETVTANAYLDAIENAASDAVVVVCIYDPESAQSSIVEDCLTTVARKHPTTRFLKLHYEIADMEHVQAPALLGYKGGDVFSTIVDVHRQIPNGRDCSSSSLEDLLMQNRIL